MLLQPHRGEFFFPDTDVRRFDGFFVALIFFGTFFRLHGVTQRQRRLIGAGKVYFFQQFEPEAAAYVSKREF